MLVARGGGYANLTDHAVEGGPVEDMPGNLQIVVVDGEPKGGVIRGGLPPIHIHTHFARVEHHRQVEPFPKRQTPDQ